MKKINDARYVSICINWDEVSASVDNDLIRNVRRAFLIYLFINLHTSITESVASSMCHLYLTPYRR